MGNIAESYASCTDENVEALARLFMSENMGRTNRAFQEFLREMADPSLVADAMRGTNSDANGLFAHVRKIINYRYDVKVDTIAGCLFHELPSKIYPSDPESIFVSRVLPRFPGDQIAKIMTENEFRTTSDLFWGVWARVQHSNDLRTTVIADVEADLMSSHTEVWDKTDLEILSIAEDFTKNYLKGEADWDGDVSERLNKTNEMLKLKFPYKQMYLSSQN